MRRLEIMPGLMRRHLAEYEEGIACALEELAKGRSLLRLYKKKVKEESDFIKCCDDPNSWEQLYISCVEAVFSAVRGDGNLLVQTPDKLGEWVVWFNDIEQYVIKNFGKDSAEHKSLKAGKDKIADLFDYAKFSEGKKLVVQTKDNRPRFRWDDSQEGWGGWFFLKQLNTATCSYCNSDGVFTLKYEQRVKENNGQKKQSVIKHKKSELDHFWPRAEFPFLGLSLYNLVPSCTRCNRNIKGAEYEPLAGMTHPYRDDFHEGAKFYAVFKDYKGLTHPNDTGVDVIIDRPTGPHSVDLAKRAKKSAEFFHLEEVYNQIYELEVNDVVRKVLYFPESYLADLRKRYPGIDESVLNRMTLGTSLNPADINKLPHEKLRQDIHSQLWIHSSVTKSCTCGRTR